MNRLPLIWVLAFSLLFSAACTTTQKTVAYQTLDAVASTVDSAMKAYADAVVAGKVDATTQAKVRELKAQYETAFVAAVTAAKANLQSPAPSDLATVSDALINLIKGHL